MVELISKSYKVLGYDGPVPEGFTLCWMEVEGSFFVVAFEKIVPVPQSTVKEHTFLRHYINANGTVVVKSTQVQQF